MQIPRLVIKYGMSHSSEYGHSVFYGYPIHYFHNLKTTHDRQKQIVDLESTSKTSTSVRNIYLKK